MSWMDETSQNQALHGRPLRRCAQRVLVVGLALLGSAGCGHERWGDGPLLYFVEGPSVVRDGNDHVVVTGELWSVQRWPAGHEFCVVASWDEPAPAAAESPMDLDCSTDAVPQDAETSDGYSFSLRSAQPIAPPGPGQPPWSLAVRVASDFHDNRDEDIRETVSIE